MATKLRKVQTYCERLPPVKPHDLLITRPKRGHVTILEIHTVFPLPQGYGH